MIENRFVCLSCGRYSNSVTSFSMCTACEAEANEPTRAGWKVPIPKFVGCNSPWCKANFFLSIAMLLVAATCLVQSVRFFK